MKRRPAPLRLSAPDRISSRSRLMPTSLTAAASTAGREGGVGAPGSFQMLAVASQPEIT